jgi:Transposase IS116/IS110/IS902 family
MEESAIKAACRRSSCSVVSASMLSPSPTSGRGRDSQRISTSAARGSVRACHVDLSLSRNHSSGWGQRGTRVRRVRGTAPVPSEHSSGEQRRQGSITKAGNAHVRRLLVESAWHARRRPTVGYELARRQRGQDAAVIERAWRCQKRLHQRWQRMAARGKPHQKIVVACARELAGFVWAIPTNQPLRSTTPGLSASA